MKQYNYAFLINSIAAKNLINKLISLIDFIQNTFKFTNKIEYFKNVPVNK